MKRRKVVIPCIIISVFFWLGCEDGGGGGTNPPATGFVVQTAARLATGMLRDNGGVIVEGCLSSFNPCPPIDGIRHFLGQTDPATAKLSVPNGQVPGTWFFTQQPSSLCNFTTTSGAVSIDTPGQLFVFVCNSPTFGTMSPDSIDVTAPPTSFSVLSPSMGASTIYGMPVIRFYDQFGRLGAETTASSVTADGTWLQAATPFLGNLYSGLYAVVIFNRQSDGTLVAIEGAPVILWGNDPPPPPEPEPDPCELGCDFVIT